MMTDVKKEVKVIPATQHSVTGKIRLAAYCRVSSDSTDQLNSFFAQVRYYNDYARGNPRVVLVDIYADEGISGTEMDKRDEFKRMIRDCKYGKIDRIVTKSVMRFARNSLECLETIRELKSYGTSVLFENDMIDTEKMKSEMTLYIKSAFAQNEATSASRRMVTSVRMRMEEGNYVSSSVPYGYELSGRELVVKPEEAAKIKTIFNMYLNGYGECIIAQVMQEHEQDGLIWTVSRIKYILQNEKYIGDSLWQKSYSTAAIPFRQKVNKGEKPKYYCENTHEPIISKEDFYAVQNYRAVRGKKYYKTPKENREFLHEKIVCRQCGWIYKKRIRNDELYWRCSKQGRTEKKCRAPSYSDREFRTAFVRMFNTLKKNERVIVDETILQLQSLKKAINRDNDAITEIDAEIASLVEQNNIYNELYVGNVIDEVMYLEKTDRYKKKISELRSRRLKLINEDEEERCLEKVRQLKNILGAYQGYMTEMNEEIFSQIVDLIYVEQNGDLTFKLKCELELTIKRGDENGK